MVVSFRGEHGARKPFPRPEQHDGCDIGTRVASRHISRPPAAPRKAGCQATPPASAEGRTPLRSCQGSHRRHPRACFVTLAGTRWPTEATTRGRCKLTLVTRTSRHEGKSSAKAQGRDENQVIKPGRKIKSSVVPGQWLIPPGGPADLCCSKGDPHNQLPLHNCLWEGEFQLKRVWTVQSIRSLDLNATIDD
jgi:hypothetical protein